jgi:pyridoxamine 5'-phosphate oxidase
VAKKIMSIGDIRKDYQLKSLTESDVDPDPLKQFEHWWQDALHAKIEEVNAMTLATASPDGVPSARILLLKGLTPNGFVFFTNYDSYKGQQIAENPRACLVFFWKEVERQVRVTGLAERLTDKENDEYFHSRPEGSRIGAWASPQSQVIENREWLEKNTLKYQQQFADQPIQRPPHWGGYIVKPITIEFWQGRPNRLHDRIQYTLSDNGKWIIERLAP